MNLNSPPRYLCRLAYRCYGVNLMQMSIQVKTAHSVSILFKVLEVD